MVVRFVSVEKCAGWSERADRGRALSKVKQPIRWRALEVFGSIDENSRDRNTEAIVNGTQQNANENQID